MDNNSKIALAIIISCSLPKLTMWNQPLFDGSAAKQIYTASMAKNLIRSNYHPLKLYAGLTVNKEGNRFVPEIRVPEAPTYHYFTIAISKIFHMELGNAGRLTSILCFSGSAYYFWLILNLLLSRISALISLFLYCFFPVTLIHTKSFQVEGLMMLCILGAVFHFLNWYKKNKTSDLIYVISFCSLGFLSKPYMLYIYVPFLWFLIQKYNHRLFFNKAAYTFLIPLIPLSVWIYFSYMENMKMNYADWELSEWILGEVFNYNWYRNLLILQIQSFTPLFLATCFFGLFLKSINRMESVMYGWLASIVIFFFLVGHKAMHDYYQIHQSPVIAYFSGSFLGSLYQSEWYKKSVVKNRFFLASGIFVVVLLLFGYANSGYLIPKNMMPNTIKLGKKIEKMTAGNDILLSGGKMDGLVFYSNRLGVVINKPDIERLELLRKLGATFYVQGKRSYKRFLGNHEFKEYLLANYHLIEMKEGEYAIFDLRESWKD